MPWSVDHVSGAGISLVDKQGVDMNTLEAARRAEAGNPVAAKIMRYAYGFDDVAIVPGSYTVNPELTDVSMKLGDHTFPIPIMAAALDAVVDPNFARKFGRLGGL